MAVPGQQRLEDLRRAATRTLLATQAVLEAYEWVEATGPLVWSPPTSGPVAWDGELAMVWSRPVEQDQDWSGGDDDIALSAALAAAEEDLTEYASERAHRRPAPGADRGNTAHHPHLRRRRAALAAAAPPADRPMLSTSRPRLEVGLV